MTGQLVRYEAARAALQAAHSIDEAIPSAPGVYAFFDGTRCLYVGESTNLRYRLKSHERRRQSPECEVRYFVCLNHKEMELQLIADLHPIKNGKSVGRERAEKHVAEQTEGTDPMERIRSTWFALFGETPSWLN